MLISTFQKHHLERVIFNGKWKLMKSSFQFHHSTHENAFMFINVFFHMQGKNSKERCIENMFYKR